MNACPLCRQAVTAPSLDEVIAARRLDSIEASILRAVWAGRGHPVQSMTIFDAMFEDDIEGGPPMAKMYAAFYAALHSMNSKLNGAGIAIKSVGHRKGWRIAFGLTS